MSLESGVESDEPEREEQRRDLEDVLGLVACHEDGASLHHPQRAAERGSESGPAGQRHAANYAVHLGTSIRRADRRQPGSHNSATRVTATSIPISLSLTRIVKDAAEGSS